MPWLSSLSVSVLEDVERLTEQVYGKGSAVSVDQVAGRWVIRCWDRKGIQKDSSVAPLPKQEALFKMRRLLQRASFLRLDHADPTEE